jgi:hypothetical protein
MKVLIFRPRKAAEESSGNELFGDFYPRATKGLPEVVKFLAGATLTFWVPTLFYCYVVGELPFYLMAFNHAVGSVLGIVLYKNPVHLIHGFIPLRRVPNIHVGGRGRKAA